MSQEDSRRGPQDVLERLCDQGRLDAILRSDHQVKQLLELTYTNVVRTRSLLKHAPDDFDWQAIPPTSAFDAASTAAASRAMRSSRFREAAAAAGTLAWGSFPSMLAGEETSNEQQAEVHQEHHNERKEV